jgi:TolB-like protein
MDSANNNKQAVMSFFDELKRRNVIRVGVAYLIVAWLIAQVTELALESFAAPEWVIKTVLFLLVIGFPITLVLAWAYEVRPETPMPAEAPEEKGEPSSVSIAPSEAAVAEAENSIVVLPFDNISPHASDAYFSEGLTEEIIMNLSLLRSLRVISRNSAVAVKGLGKSTREIAAELGVQFVLEGSVRKAGNDLRITAQLIQADTDEHVWAEKYDGVLDDVFGMQEAVSNSIVDALKITMTPSEKEKIAERSIEDAQVYDCYLKARHEIHRLSKQALEQGIRTLQNGLDLFPENALLTATLGEAYYLHFDAGWVTDDAIFNQVEELARRSLSLDPDLAQGKKLLGLLERGRGSLIEACQHMKDAYDAAPNDPGILLYTAAFLGIYAGQRALAEPIMSRLLAIDPLTAINWLFAAFLQLVADQPETAVLSFRKSQEMNPDLPHTSYFIAHAMAASGEIDGALKVLDEAIESGIPDPVGTLAVFLRHVLSYDEEGALSSLDDEARRYAWGDPDYSYLMPGYFALISRNEDALEWLQHAVDRDYINYPYLAETGPFLENLRSDPRFQEMLEEIRIKWEGFELGGSKLT